ncbi:MAG: cytochrome c oxidase assembly protein [Actinomycetota bacterium]
MISWWCVALQEPWRWQFVAYPGIWAAVFIPAGSYLRAVSRSDYRTSRRQRIQFLAGMAVFWVASDWPLGTLGAGYLASAHMAQFILYTLGAAPLLLLGTPDWLAERVISRLRIRRPLRWLSRSLVVSGAVYNLTLVATHSPGVVTALRTSQVGSFLMDVVWLLAGLVLWMPLLAPIRSLRHPSPIGRIAYLFATTSLVAVIPASFLTFSAIPLYRVYELAPRIASLTAREDQQLAGIVMKLGSIPVVWTTIAVLWFRWAASEHRESAA